MGAFTAEEGRDLILSPPSMSINSVGIRIPPLVSLLVPSRTGDPFPDGGGEGKAPYACPQDVYEWHRKGNPVLLRIPGEGIMGEEKNMPTITRRLEFDAAHRVLGHEGKCKYIHGHRYSVEITVHAPELDPLGRVVDFGVIKERVGGWIDQTLDHNTLLQEIDPLFPLLNGGENGRMPFLLKGNPTAENIAQLLHEKSVEILPPSLQVVRVRVYETPNCYAEYPG